MTSSMTIPAWVRAWFAADCALVLLPPLHWQVAPGSKIAGIPVVVAYLFGTSLVIAASIVCAYGLDRARHPGRR